MKHSTHISIGQVINIHTWLNNNPQPANVRLQQIPDDDEALILSWWRATSSQPSADPLRTAHSLIRTITFVAGALLGVSVTSVALTYSGAYPVNLLVLLGILVVLPGLTLLLSFLLRLFRHTHGSALDTLFIWSLTRLDQAYAEFLDTNLWRYGSCLYWHTQRYLQRFSLTFLFTAMLTFFSLIAFTDIAFGWSSTLQLQAATVFTMTEVLSLPWQAWLPAAHPSLELIEASRFYRMNPDNNPALLGQWWPFISMCILVWAIGPRLLMAWFTARRVQSTTRAALLNHPDVTALLNHLRRPAVTFTSSTEAPANSDDTADVADFKAQIPAAATIAWNGAGRADGEVLQIGLGASAAELNALLSELPTDAGLIRVLVKGWEPPLLEFLDFVQALRQAAGEQVSISVQTLSLDEGDAPLNESELQAWRSCLAKLHDPKVYVEVIS